VNIGGRYLAQPPFVVARSPSAEAEAVLRDEGGEQDVSDDARAEWEGLARYAPACGSTAQAGGAHTTLHASSYAHNGQKQPTHRDLGSSSAPSSFLEPNQPITADAARVRLRTHSLSAPHRSPATAANNTAAKSAAS
jgi:hypothetical protein